MAQFRIVCGIARRGVCFESGPRMARRFRMDDDTFWDALKYLVQQGIIVKEKRHGQSTIHRVAPLSAWKEPTGKYRVGSHRKRQGDGRRNRPGNHPPENTGHKVYPIEVDPVKGNGIPPAKLFPRERREKIRELRADLGRLAANHPDRSAVYAMLCENEKAEYGRVKTKSDYGLEVPSSSTNEAQSEGRDAIHAPGDGDFGGRIRGHFEGHKRSLMTAPPPSCVRGWLLWLRRGKKSFC